VLGLRRLRVTSPQGGVGAQGAIVCGIGRPGVPALCEELSLRSAVRCPSWAPEMDPVAENRSSSRDYETAGLRTGICIRTSSAS